MVEIQDFLLLAMPLIAATASVWALRMAPRLAFIWRVAIGGAGAFVFGHIYFQYFRWVIVETLHSWRRDEGLLWYLATYVGLLIMVGAVLGMTGGGMFAAGKKVVHQVEL